MDPDDRVIVHPQHNREGFAMQAKWLPLALGLTLALGLAEVKAQEPAVESTPTATAQDPQRANEIARLKKTLAELQKQIELLEGKGAGKDALADDKTITAEKLDQSLLQAVNSGTVLYQFGQHEQAAYIYHVALINALAALDKIKADELKLTGPELRNLKFRVVRAMATPAKDAAWRAVAQRTAINDIRNVKLRHPDKGSPKDTLVERMGGQIALAFIYRDAMGGTVPGRPASDCATAFPFYFNPYLNLFGATPDFNRLAVSSSIFHQGIQPGIPFFASGGLPFGGLSPYGFGGLSPYGFGMPFGNTAQLQTALRNYCVPEPEANEFIARMMGLDGDDSKTTK